MSQNKNKSDSQRDNNKKQVPSTSQTGQGTTTQPTPIPTGTGTRRFPPYVGRGSLSSSTSTSSGSASLHPVHPSPAQLDLTEGLLGPVWSDTSVTTLPTEEFTDPQSPHADTSLGGFEYQPPPPTPSSQLSIITQSNPQGTPLGPSDVGGQWQTPQAVENLDFKSFYQRHQYYWSDPILATFKWEKNQNPAPLTLKLARGYYRAKMEITAAGNSNVRLYLQQTTQANAQIIDNLYDASPSGCVSAETRFTVSESVGYMVCAVPISSERTGHIQLWIQKRGSELPPVTVTVGKIEKIDTIGKVNLVEKLNTVGTLEQLTKRDLGHLTPLWTSTLPQRTSPTAKGTGKQSPLGEPRYVKDLTAQGIEPNPGPTELLDSILQRSKTHHDLESCLLLLGHLESALPTNPFAILTEIIMDETPLPVNSWTPEFWAMMTEDLESDTSTKSGLAMKPKPSLSGASQGRDPLATTSKTSKRHDTVDKKMSKDGGSTKPPTPSSTTMIARRLLRRIRKEGSTNHNLAQILLDTNISRPVKTVLCNVMWRADWMKQTKLSSLQYLALWATDRLSDQEVFDTIVDYMTTMTNKPYDSDLRAESFSLLSSSPYIAGATKIHNKMMHALNGNIFVKDFKELCELPNYWSVITAPPGPGPSNDQRIGDFETFFTGFTQHDPQALGFLENQGMIHGEVVARNNQIFTNRNMNCPASPLWPYRPIYHATDRVIVPPTDAEAEPGKDAKSDPPPEKDIKYVGWANAPVMNMPYLHSSDVEYKVNPLTPTNRAEKALLMLTETLATKFRQTDLDTMGFLSYDMYSMAGVTTTKGLSMEKPVLRLLILHDILMLHKNRCVPASIYNNIIGTMLPDTTREMEVKFRAGEDAQIDEFDNYLQFDDFRTVTSPTNSFPFVGIKGKLKFHMTLETVGHVNYDNVLFAPPWLYDNFPNEREAALALYILMFSEWPYGLYTVHGDVCAMQTPDGPLALNQGTDAGYVHLGSLTRISGLTNIDVILPRRAPTGRLTTPSDAKTSTYVIPKFGPNGPEANNEMNICAHNNGTTNVDYTLWDYLHSWATYWTPMFIHRFFTNMNATIGISRHINAMSDLMVAAVYNMPSLISDSTGGENPYDTVLKLLEDKGFVMADQLFKVHTAWHGERPSTTDRSMPWVKDRIPSFYLMETSILGWNRVALALSSSEDTAQSNVMEASDLVGNNKVIFWNVLKSLILTTPMSIYYNIQGMSAATWDLAIDYPYNRAVRDVALASFARIINPSTLQPPMYYGVMMNIYNHVNTLPLGTAYTMMNGAKIEVTVYARSIRPKTFAKTLGIFHKPVKEKYVVPFFETNDYYTPVLLADVWLHVIMQKGIKFMGNMFAGYITDGTFGFNRCTSGSNPPNMTIVREKVTHGVGPYIDMTNMNMGIPDNVRPRLSDEHLWNVRLFLTQGAVDIKTLMLQEIEESYGDVNPYQRCAQEVYAYETIWNADAPPNRRINIRCNTMCYPYMVKTNDIAIPITTVDTDAKSLVSAMNHQSPAPRTIWRLNHSVLPTEDEYYVPGPDPWAALLDPFAKAATITTEAKLPEVVVAQVHTPVTRPSAPPEETTATVTQSALQPNQVPESQAGGQDGPQ